MFTKCPVRPRRLLWAAIAILSPLHSLPARGGEAELVRLAERFEQELDAKLSSQKFTELLSRHALVAPGGPQLMYLGRTGHPVFFGTHNLDAAKTISTLVVWPLPMGGGLVGLDGSNTYAYELGLWDEAAVLLTHQEFGGRVRQKDSPTGTSDHATHVAGTMVSEGQFNAASIGMSFRAKLRAYDWNGDAAEMALAASRSMRISNHSYGSIVGWYEPTLHEDPQDGEPGPGATWWWYGDLNVHPLEDWRFGFYTTEAADWDAIADQALHYLIVKSAGNDRVDFGPAPGALHNHIDPLTQNWVSDSDVHDPDGGGLNYDTIASRATAKNILTVGAVQSNPSGYSGPASVVMTSFSGWGPTDDGRIKPDLVADGLYLTSTTDTGIGNYAVRSGTSMAAPGVAGSANLVREYLMAVKHSWVPRAATLKGILIQTADEAGANAGPDYAFGWGQMNTAAAVNLVDAEKWDNGHIVEATLTNGGLHEYYVLHEGANPLRITLAWTDPPAAPPLPAVDPPSSMLIHDLDLRAEHVDLATLYFPWILDPLNPGNAAAHGDNFRDNVEQIELSPSGGGGAKKADIGYYRITVNHKGTLFKDQTYSLIADAPLKTCVPAWTDVTPAGMAMPGITVGASWADYDGDGDDDVYLTQYSASNKLFRNDGGGIFTDVSAAPVNNAGDSRGAAWADYDNDGDPDLYVPEYSALATNHLYRNEGAGIFSDVTSSVTQGAPGNHLGATWVDVDNDGWVDLYLCVQGSNQLLHNGGGVFADITTAVLGDPLMTSAAAWGDYDGDGDQDLYLVNVGANKLLRNDGAPNFTDVTAGVLGDSGTGLGAAWGDMDNDGDLDLYLVNNFDPNKLMRNDGGGVFTDVTSGLLAGPQYAMATDFLDFDNDGDLDIFVGAQFGNAHALYQNDGAGSFINFTYPSLAMHALDSDGLGVADYDGDGDLDLLSTHNNGSNALMQSSLCSFNHWLKVKLVGTASNASAIGARVELTAGGRTQIREVNSGVGRGQGSLPVEFGLGAATVVDQLLIRWPSGNVEIFPHPVVVDQTIEVIEGAFATDTPQDVPATVLAVRSYPNPFNPEVTIQFEISRPDRVSVEIFDVAGRRVRGLLQAARLPSGPHTLDWRGRDESGRLLSSGIYFCRVATSIEQRTVKMVLVK